MDNEDRIYLWADGVYSDLCSSGDMLCALVNIGVNSRGEKHYLAIENGLRESTQSWREVLQTLLSRGVNTARLAIGDCARVFWTSLEEVYPETKQQHRWMHKTLNVLNVLPKANHPYAKQALHDIWKAETKAQAERAFDPFLRTYEAKYPKATAFLQKDREGLLSFYGFPENSGKACVRAIPSNRPLAPYGIAPSIQRAASHGVACYT